MPEASTIASEVASMVIVSGSLSLSNVCKNCAILSTVASSVAVLATPAKSCGMTLPSELIAEAVISPTVMVPTLKVIVSPAL